MWQDTTTKTMGAHHYQNNSLKGWSYMSIYWAIGFLIGQRQGYTERLTTWPSSWWTFWHFLAFGTTIECQRRFVTRFTNMGRPRRIGATMIFALMNGVLETMYFLCVYDIGRNLITSNRWMGIFLGWTLYYIYNAVIHVGFWLKLVFPDHTRTDAPPFHKHGLLLLTILSIGWIGMYEFTHDVAFICCLHVIIDGWASWSMGLQGPFDGLGGSGRDGNKKL